MKTVIFSQGKTSEGVLDIEAKKPQMGLLAQALRVYEAHTHSHLAKTKTRGEVNISTRKIYRQKGTGGARHGAKSAPIFVGGGTAHGPKGVQRPLVLPKAVRKLALSGMFYLAQKEKKIVGVVLPAITKTKEAGLALEAVRKAYPFQKGLVLLTPGHLAWARYFYNLPWIKKVMSYKQVSPWDIFSCDLVLVETEKKRVVATQAVKPKEVKK